MSAATVGGRQQEAAGCGHLSKKTRVELLANDHNYSAVAPAPANGNGPSGGRMDDCAAAMLLMFLSSRPGEQVGAGDCTSGAQIAQPAIVLNGKETSGEG